MQAKKRELVEVCGKWTLLLHSEPQWNILYHQKIISWNQFSVRLLSKNVNFTKIMLKSLHWYKNFVTSTLSVCTYIMPLCGKMKDLLSLDWKRKIRQINYLVILLVQPLLSRNFCQKRVISTLCYSCLIGLGKNSWNQNFFVNCNRWFHEIL